MWILIIAIAAVLESFSFSYAADQPRTYTNEDLKQFGSSSQSNNSGSVDSPCVIIDYKTADEVQTRVLPGSTSGQFIGNQYYGNTYGGGVRQTKRTYLSVTIRNISTKKAIQVTANDIKVFSIKGNSISPEAAGSVHIPPGDVRVISGLLFPNGLSGVSDISCTAY